MKTFKKALAVMLALLMLLTVVPSFAFAEETVTEETVTEETVTEETVTEETVTEETVTEETVTEETVTEETVTEENNDKDTQEDNKEEKKLNFVMMGDSIAWGAGVLNSSDACYAKIIADSNGYNYTTLASNGYMTSHILREFENEKDAAAIKNADIIAMSFGGNNYLYAGVIELIYYYLIGDMRLFDSVAADFRTDFDLIIKKIREVNPDVTIIVQTLCNTRYDILRPVFQEGANRINAAIRQSKIDNPDSFEILELDNVLTQEYVASDTIHPNKAGNELIAKLYLEKLKELGLGENTELVIETAGMDQMSSDPATFPYAIRYFFRAVKFYIMILFKIPLD